MIQNMASTGFRKVSMNMVDLTKLTFSQTSLVFFTEREGAAGQGNDKEERMRSTYSSRSTLKNIM